MQNINKKRDENNYFRAEIGQKEEKQATLKEKKEDWIIIIEKIYFFSKIQHYKSKFANIYISYEKLAHIFDIKTLKLF